MPSSTWIANNWKNRDAKFLKEAEAMTSALRELQTEVALLRNDIAKLKGESKQPEAGRTNDRSKI